MNNRFLDEANMREQRRIVHGYGYKLPQAFGIPTQALPYIRQARIVCVGSKGNSKNACV